jgi:hypothetical protein
LKENWTRCPSCCLWQGTECSLPGNVCEDQQKSVSIGRFLGNLIFVGAFRFVNFISPGWRSLSAE